MTPLVLLLGGTTEASALAAELAGETRLRTILSLAGATRSPPPSPVKRRIGGFGGAEGLTRFVRDEGVRLILDATHPFAVRIGANAREAARRGGVPLVRLTRPPWTAVEGDRWIEVDAMAEAAERLGPAPLGVLLTIGRSDLAPFRTLPHRFVVRSVDPPPAELLPDGARVIAARGPFAFDDEMALFRHERIDVLVTKNSGGAATAAKLAAARMHGATVLMVRRPVTPADAEALTDVEAALRLVRHACLGA